MNEQEDEAERKHFHILRYSVLFVQKNVRDRRQCVTKREKKKVFRSLMTLIYMFSYNLIEIEIKLIRLDLK